MRWLWGAPCTRCLSCPELGSDTWGVCGTTVSSQMLWERMFLAATGLGSPLVLGKAASAWRAGMPGAKQMSVSALIRVSPGECCAAGTWAHSWEVHGLARCDPAPRASPADTAPQHPSVPGPACSQQGPALQQLFTLHMHSFHQDFTPLKKRKKTATKKHKADGAWRRAAQPVHSAQMPLLGISPLGLCP